MQDGLLPFGRAWCYARKSMQVRGGARYSLRVEVCRQSACGGLALALEHALDVGLLVDIGDVKEGNASGGTDAI